MRRRLLAESTLSRSAILTVSLASDDTSYAVSAERYRDAQIGKYAVWAWR